MMFHMKNRFRSALALPLALLFCTVGTGGLTTAFAAPKKLIHPKEFPKGRPFSPGLLVGDTLYVAGQVGQDLKTGNIPDDFEAEVKQTLDNIALVLKEAGMTFDNAVSVNVYLTDIELFQRMNAVYITYFKEPRPVRTTVAISKLVGKARIEITVTASK
jgi:2-iminobutanoate/2-iminopropanoate deaminase